MKVERLLVVFNPISGSKFIRFQADDIQKQLAALSVQYAWFETVAKEEQPLAHIIDDSFDRILIVGGDGTVRQVVEFLLEQNYSIPICVLPQGSGNVLAWTLGFMPVLPLKRALKKLLETEPKPFDVLRVNDDHVALFVVGQGYDTLFVRETSRSLKRALGIAAYFVAFLKTFFVYRRKPYRITVDGDKFELSAKLVMAINLFSIVGVSFDHDISPYDGEIEVLVFNPRSLWDYLYSAFRLVRKTHWSESGCYQIRTGKHITIEQLNADHIQMDGDIVAATKADIQVLPGAIELVVP